MVHREKLVTFSDVTNMTIEKFIKWMEGYFLTPFITSKEIIKWYELKNIKLSGKVSTIFIKDFCNLWIKYDSILIYVYTESFETVYNLMFFEL